MEAVGEYLRSQVQSGDSGHVRCDSVISLGSFGSASLVYNGRRNITDEVKRMAGRAREREQKCCGHCWI